MESIKLKQSVKEMEFVFHNLFSHLRYQEVQVSYMSMYGEMSDDSLSDEEKFHASFFKCLINRRVSLSFWKSKKITVFCGVMQTKNLRGVFYLFNGGDGKIEIFPMDNHKNEMDGVYCSSGLGAANGYSVQDVFMKAVEYIVSHLDKEVSTEELLDDFANVGTQTEKQSCKSSNNKKN